MPRYRIKKWDEFQHYKDRSPPWLKLHRKLLDDYDFQRLPIASKALAPMLWLLASESEDGSIDGDIDRLSFRLRWSVSDVSEGLNPLIDGGFLVDAIDVLADCNHAAPTENREQRQRTEKISAPKKPAPSDVPEGFMVAWKAYPSRPGMNRADSMKAWRARVNAGADPQAIIDGVIRYAAFCKATCTAPQFIKQPATFFGPGEHYLSDWTVPPAHASPSSVAASREETSRALTGRGKADERNERDITGEVVVITGEMDRSNFQPHGGALRLSVP